MINWAKTVGLYVLIVVGVMVDVETNLNFWAELLTMPNYVLIYLVCDSFFKKEGFKHKKKYRYLVAYSHNEGFGNTGS